MLPTVADAWFATAENTNTLVESGITGGAKPRPDFKESLKALVKADATPKEPPKEETGQ